MSTPMWRPSSDRVEQANVTAFLDHLARRWDVQCDSFDELWRYSVRDGEAMATFWRALWTYSGVLATRQGDTAIQDYPQMPGARFFPDAQLNFAENLLRRRDDADAIVFWGEDKVRRSLTHAELYERVSRLSQVLRDEGVRPGDRVAAALPNMPETVIAMLATTAVGGIFSSCSPDFGTEVVMDRFGQIEPKVLLVTDAYYYNGKPRDGRSTAVEVAGRLPSLNRVLLVPYAGDGDATPIPNGQRIDEAEARHPAGEIEFTPMPFNHPVYILFTSGTTGKPKCIAHSAGGVLLKHLCEHQLHCDVKPGDRVYYFTTCGWMMWNWVVTGLASKATVVLYDGSPLYPDWRPQFRMAEQERVTFFGTSAKFIDHLGNEGARPKEEFDLSPLRTIASTGSPLMAEGFDIVYENIKTDVHLSSISGGTDIVGCFVDGNPVGPVYRGEIQTPVLGMDVDVYDQQGNSLPPGEKGELVCKQPFPSMPPFFWNDPEGERFHKAYFATFPGIWHHGDFAAKTETGGIIIYGRSDATLNPGGVRIGTAEIYRQVEKLDEVLESIVAGQQTGDDERVVLFVRLVEGQELTDDLIDRIGTTIRKGASPRHVPAKVLAVPDIPRTRSGKIVELAVADVLHGREVRNRDALANPEALEHFTHVPD